MFSVSVPGLVSELGESPCVRLEVLAVHISDFVCSLVSDSNFRPCILIVSVKPIDLEVEKFR